jgi:hypothetical protein
VTATLALFAALAGGAYAVTKAPKDSVVSASIKNGQVKPPDLSKNVRAVPLRYSKPIGSTIQTTIVNTAGYKLVASCENASGQPAIDVSLRVPKTGVLDIAAVNKPAVGLATPLAGREAPAGSSIDLFDPPFGPDDDSDDSFGALMTYTAPGKAAVFSLHLYVSGTTNRCALGGALVPLT